MYIYDDLIWWMTALSPCAFATLQPTTKLFIDGKFVESNTSEWLDIHNPVSVNAYTHTTTGVHNV